MPVIDARNRTVEPDGGVCTPGGDVRVVQTRIDVRKAQVKRPEVLEDMAIHERRPAFSCAIGTHGVVVDVPVALVGEEPEGDEPEHIPGLVENPDLLGMSCEQVTVLLDLPFLPAQLRFEPDGLVAVLAEQFDEARLNRRVAVDGEPIDGVEIWLARAAQNRPRSLRNDVLLLGSLDAGSVSVARAKPALPPSAAR